MDEAESVNSLLNKTQHTYEKDGIAEVAKLFTEICELDGHLIPIPNIKSRLNEPLFLMTRLTTNSDDPNLRYLAIDVIAKRDSEYIPVGMKDYEIKDDTANGNKQQHNQKQWK